MRFLVLAGLLLTPFAALAQDERCEASPSDVQAATDLALEAFRAMDVGTFKTHTDDARTALGCLREPLTPAQAASWHRLMALSAFLARDQDGAVARFLASKMADPGASLPEEIAPDGHPLDKLFDSADPEQVGPIEALVVPEGGRAWVDGDPEAATRPLDRPAVVQLADPEGIVVDTADLIVGARPRWSDFEFVPATPDEPEPTPAPEPEPEPKAKAGPHVGLTVAAALAATTSAATFGAATASRTRFEDPQTPYGDLEAIRGRTNGLTAVSGVAAAGALGLGVAAFTVSF